MIAGSRLVVSAAAKQVSEEASTVASRATRHGLDLSSKAQGSSQEFVDTINRLAKSSIPEAFQNSRHQFVNGYNGQTDQAPSSSYAPGANPYESQLQSQQLEKNAQDIAAIKAESSEGESSILDPDLKSLHSTNNSRANSQSQPNQVPKTRVDPFLLHAQVTDHDQNDKGIYDELRGESDTSITHELLDSAPTAPRNSEIELAIGTENQILSTPQNSELSGKDEPLRIEEGQAVPSTRIGRAAGFASLGFGLAIGTASELASRLIPGLESSKGSSVVVTDANADRLAATLCRMRGAALKMGQMLSIQDESLLPPALSRALLQVRQGAHAMPNYQLVQQLESQLGTDWRNKFVSFDELPFAAASIGQVHRARIAQDGVEKDVVVKVQYPGVASSIESDLRNLAMLVKMTGLSPKGLFIENVIRVGRDELKVECNYINEMANQIKLQELVASDPYLVDQRFVVPNVIEDVTTEQVITTDYAPGGTIDKVSHLDQEERNRIGRTILYLTMKELFDWRLMQTDPNWGNFLYDVGTRRTTLIDFGATRSYSKEFVDGYLRIVWASANRDETTLMEQSRRMDFLTGEENDTMLRAHKLSGFTVGEPFWTDDEPFDFRGSNISTRMGEHTSVFLRHRLT